MSDHTTKVIQVAIEINDNVHFIWVYPSPNWDHCLLDQLKSTLYCGQIIIWNWISIFRCLQKLMAKQ